MPPASASSPSASPQPAPESLTKQAGYLLLARIIGFVLSTAFPLVLVRLLEKHDFGLYRQSFLILNTALQVLPLGVTMSVYYFLPREKERQGSVVLHTVGFIMAFGGIFTLLFALTPGIAVWITREPAVAPFSPLIGVAIPLWLVGALLEHLLMARQETKFSSLVTVLIQLTRMLFFLGAALLFGTVYSLIFAAVLHGALQTLAVFAVVSRLYPGWWRGFDLALLRRQLSYALPMGLLALLMTAQTEVHSYVVSRLYGAVQFGVYSVGCFQLPIIGMLLESVGSVLIPAVTRLAQDGRKAEILRLVYDSMRKLGLILFPIFGYLTVVAYEFITLLYQEKYAESVPVFRINLFLILGAFLIYDPIMRPYPEFRFRLLAFRLALFVGQTAALIWATHTFGLQGTITVVVIAVTVERLFMMTFFSRFLGMGPEAWQNLRHLGMAAIAMGAAMGVTFAVKQWLLLPATVSLNPPALGKFLVLAATGPIFVAIYALLSAKLGALGQEERAQLHRIPYVGKRLATLATH